MLVKFESRFSVTGENWGSPNGDKVWFSVGADGINTGEGDTWAIGVSIVYALGWRE